MCMARNVGAFDSAELSIVTRSPLPPLTSLKHGTEQQRLWYT